MARLICAPLARQSAPRWLRRLARRDRDWQFLRRADDGERVAPLGAELERLTARVETAGTVWIARVVGRDEDIAHLRAAVAAVTPATTWTAEPSGGWRRSQVVMRLASGDAERSVLLRGEGVSDYTVLMLLVAELDVAEVITLLRDGDDDAAFALAQLTLAYRAGSPWAAVTSPRGAVMLPASLVTIDRVAARPPRMAVSPPPRQLALIGIIAVAVVTALVVVASRGSAPGVRQGGSVARSTTAPTTAAPARPAPQARQLAASAYDPDGDITVVFGGIATGGSGRELDDTWIWNGRSWSQQSPNDVIGFRTDAPAARHGAVMAYAPGAHGLVLFGGTARDPTTAPLNDTWVWNRTKWTRLDVAGPPSTAVTVAMSYDLSAGQLVLVTADTQSDPERLQTWTWNAEISPTLVPGGTRWTLHPDATTPQIHLMAPDPRGGHVIAVVSTHSGPGEEATWRWDGKQWLEQHPASAVVVESITATFTDDLADGTAVLVEEQFVDQTGEDRGGTWTWDGKTWSHHAGEVPNIVHAFDVAEPLWYPHGDGLDIVGGPRQGDTYNATWHWDGTVWSSVGTLAAAAYPAPR
jgi:hypothetical protein